VLLTKICLLDDILNTVRRDIESIKIDNCSLRSHRALSLFSMQILAVDCRPSCYHIYCESSTTLTPSDGVLSFSLNFRIRFSQG
jgi:hypothetical protein